MLIIGESEEKKEKIEDYYLVLKYGAGCGGIQWKCLPGDNWRKGENEISHHN